MNWLTNEHYQTFSLKPSQFRQQCSHNARKRRASLGRPLSTSLPLRGGNTTSAFIQYNQGTPTTKITQPITARMQSRISGVVGIQDAS